MLVAAGNINDPYVVIGVVHAVAARTPKTGGCSGPSGLPIQDAYEEATRTLELAAERSGANGLIHVSYDHRISTSAVGCGGNAQAVIEVYAWGTAIRLPS